MIPSDENTFEKRICLYKPCSKIFTPTRDWQKYCCTEHRKADWQSKHPKLTPTVIRRIDKIEKDIEVLNEKTKKL